MNRDFLFKYICATLLVIMLLSVAFFYDKKHQEQHLEHNLLAIIKQIDLLDLELNQDLLRLHFNLSKEAEITHHLNKLSNDYHSLSGKISKEGKLYDDLMRVRFDSLYSQLYKKRQAIEQFKYQNKSLNQHANEFQQLSNWIVSQNNIDPVIKNKIYQLQILTLPHFLNSSTTTTSLSKSLNELSQLIPKNNQQLVLFTQKADILFKEEKKIHSTLNALFKLYNPALSESIEQQIIRYFNNRQEKKSELQNSLFITALFSVLYVVYLLSSLRKKSTLLSKVLGDIEKQQVALNQHAIVSAADVKGNITYVNDKFCETSGYTREELMGKNHRIVKSDEHDKEVFETMWQTICQGKVWHGEIKNNTKDGGFYWVNGTIVPFLNERGKPYQYISIRTDITRQKQLEKQLLEGQHFLKQVTDTMAQGLYALDENGLCIFWNKEAEHILGWSEQELLNKSVHEIIHFQDENKQPISKENCLSHNAILNNKIYNSETEFFTHKDGHVLPISIIAVPLLETNKTIGTVAVFSDITKRKEDERIVNQAIINAQQASQAKSDFLANMSHEIRTPMNGIIGMTELTLDTDLNSEQKEFLEIVKDSSYALLEIVNDILDFSKIESGKLVLEQFEFDLNDLLKRTLAILIPKASQKGVTLSIENIESTEFDCLLIGDPGRLRQVILNLVGNAIKFTLQGSVKVSVTLEEKNEHQCFLLFTIVDTGIGIPEDKQASIFEAFSQADTSVTRRFGGTGLGLSISKQFIELMGGHIWLNSEPNVGTTFFFTCWFDYKMDNNKSLAPLPAQSNNLSDLQKLPMNTHNMTSIDNENKSSLKILLAEDNLINQKLAKKLLEKQGYEVKIANNGLEAIAWFEQEKFDLILMDFQMPEMNGLEATEKIRLLEQNSGNDRHIPIIAMTANAMKEDKERAINAGMDAYVPKPINVQELLAQIAQFFPAKSDSVVNAKKPDNTTICNWDAALTRLGGEVEILEMLVNLFLEEHPSYITSIKHALAQKDTVLLERELHTLRGVCATIGAEKIEKNIKTPENLAAQGDISGCTETLAEIEQDLFDLADFLRQKLKIA